MMGGGDSASGGETLKIAPRGKTGNEDVIEAIYATKLDPREFALTLRDLLLQDRR